MKLINKKKKPQTHTIAMFIWGIGGRMKVGRREREEIDEIPLFGRGQKGREGEAKPSRPTKIDPPKIGLI